VHLRSIVIVAVLSLSAAAQTPPAGSPAPAQPPASAKPSASAGTRVAIIQFQQAVLSTQEGQQATAAMKTKFDPRKAQLEKRQADIQAMQEKLQRGGATLTNDARSKMQNDVAAGTRALNHDAEDLNNEVQEEESKLMQNMGYKMGEIIRDYASKNGYTIVLDVSAQATPVLWAAPAVNITEAIVKLYDQQHPAKGGGGSSPPPPPAKKQ
jgi:outer membrane protein